jgi:hypothetical protein
VRTQACSLSTKMISATYNMHTCTHIHTPACSTRSQNNVHHASYCVCVHVCHTCAHTRICTHALYAHTHFIVCVHVCHICTHTHAYAHAHTYTPACSTLSHDNMHHASYWLCPYAQVLISDTSQGAGANPLSTKRATLCMEMCLALMLGTLKVMMRCAWVRARMC